MKNSASYYESLINKVKSVHRTDYETIFVYNKGEVLWSGPASEVHNHEFPREAIRQIVFDKESYKKVSREASAEYSRILDEFRQDLFESCGVENNPKRCLLFGFAWGEGHSEGLQRVCDWFEEHVELIY